MRLRKLTFDLCLTSVLKQNANNQHFDILKKYREFKQVFRVQ